MLRFSKGFQRLIPTIAGISVITVLGVSYIIGLDRLEAGINRLIHGRIVPVNDWIYLKGDPYFEHRLPLDGTVKTLGRDFKGHLWIVYWVPCNTPGALIPSPAFRDECFCPAYSTDLGLSWIKSDSLPNEIRQTMTEAFSCPAQQVIVGPGATYQIRSLRPKGLYSDIEGQRELVETPRFNGIEIDSLWFWLLALDPSDPNHLFVRKPKEVEAFAFIEGLWESKDRGKSFEPLSWIGRETLNPPKSDDKDRCYQTSGFNFLAIDPHQPMRMISDQGGALTISQDGGRHWYSLYPQNQMDYSKPLFAFPKMSWYRDAEFYAGYFDPTLLGRVYIVSSLGLLVSADSGRTWRLSNLGTGGFRPRLTICLVPEAKAIFVGSRRGLLKSTDGGERWERIDLGFQRNLIKSLVPYLPPPNAEKSEHKALSLPMIFSLAKDRKNQLPFSSGRR